jgi:predicted RNase H-like HicB family nuclease
VAEGLLGDVFAAAGGALIAPPYDVTLERGSDGTYLAWVNDLPGCALRGRTRDEVVEALPAAIAEFLAWTGASGAAPPAVTVVDELDSVIEAEEDTEALVAADREPLTEERWTEAEHWLRRSRQELHTLLERLTDDELDSRREVSSRSVREEIEHLAFVELMYVAWTFDLQTREGLAKFLGWTRAIAAERMTTLAGDHNADLTSARWAGAPRPEPWTARKAARRLVWHELLHLRAIQRFVGR